MSFFLLIKTCAQFAISKQTERGVFNYKLYYMNWFIITPVVIVLAVLVFFLIKRNMQDEKTFENQLNNDYPKSKDEEGDVDIDENIK